MLKVMKAFFLLVFTASANMFCANSINEIAETLVDLSINKNALTMEFSPSLSMYAAVMISMNST